MTVLTHSQITHLPVSTSHEKHRRENLVEFWKAMHADAGSKKECAWREHGEAVDSGESPEVVANLLAKALTFEEICQGTWVEWQEAKRSLLALFS